MLYCESANWQEMTDKARLVVAKQLEVENGIMARSLLPTELSHSMNFVVQPEHTTSYIDARLPEVLATCTLVMWMETVASLAVQPYLTEGYITVGIDLSVEHLSFTTVNQTLQIECSVTTVTGNFVDFDIVATVNAKTVGKGKHRRAIISQKLIQRQISKQLKEN
ncbi:hypothetical protein LEP3755_11180 [Leptolyngbya sp. NIES-3755]|nr:hypothetical protein LEP3755_11180 [Leptolyngbya sp. NIES-3755]